MSIRFLILFCLSNCLASNAQVLLNGASVFTSQNAQVVIQTDSLLIDQNGRLQQNGFLIIEKDAVINYGLLENEGTIEINGNVVNNDSLLGQSSNSQFFVQGHWVNNDYFNAGQSVVVLNGTVQEIRGSQISAFYNLETIGAITDVKHLVGTNAQVSNRLDLTNVEFATNNNKLTITNPATNAISRNSGFVSSLSVGRLERATNSTNTYIFPTGSTNGITRYRPIELTPNSNNITQYGVRLANVNATSEGYNVLNLNDSLCSVNPNFYHRIYGSESADIKQFYISSEDGEWNAIAHWQNVADWHKAPNEMQTSATSFEEIEINNWSDFSEPVFALGSSRPDLSLNADAEISMGQTTTIVADYSGPNPQQIIWTPIDFINCFDCLEIEVEPFENTIFNIEISVTETCVIMDSIVIIVNPDELHLPTAFSPNDDGTNDQFGPLNKNIIDYHIAIWNRWGEMVYQSNDFRDGWNGTFRNENAPLGVYSYAVEYKFENRNESLSKNGNVTLLR